MTMESIVLFVVYLILAVDRVSSVERGKFLKQFVDHQNRPGCLVAAFRNDDIKNTLMKIAKDVPVSITDVFTKDDKAKSVIYLAELNNETTAVLQKAEENRSLKAPARWILFYKIYDEVEKDLQKFINEDKKHREAVENMLFDTNISIDTEVYVAFEHESHATVYLAYRISPKANLIWELYSEWTSEGFNRPPPETPLAVTRHDVQGHTVTSVMVVSHNSTYSSFENYLKSDVDTSSKLTYYLTTHVWEWMNATGVLHSVPTYGYQRPDGSYDGVMKELLEGTSDFSATIFFVTKERLAFVEYVLCPTKADVYMIFRKPFLASVTNIYLLPFKFSVWLAVLVLGVVATVLLTGSTYWEAFMKQNPHNSLQKRLTQAFYEIVGGMIFQQGTTLEPESVSSRQVVVLGLLAFMFLHTAYSANVVALLQSTTDITGPVGILNSPMKYGATNHTYNRHIFKTENRPLHQVLWLEKGLPQGEKFFLTVQEGVRRVREGLFAFHVEITAGFNEVQRTFLEHEKCNLGYFKYVNFSTPQFGVSKKSPFREIIRIGTVRIHESGVQRRSEKRIIASPPKCRAGTAFFTAVGIQEVAPAFYTLLVLYAVVLGTFGLEILVCEYEKTKGTRNVVNE